MLHRSIGNTGLIPQHGIRPAGHFRKTLIARMFLNNGFCLQPVFAHKVINDRQAQPTTHIICYNIGSCHCILY
jgi:hypothetical protein